MLLMIRVILYKVIELYSLLLLVYALMSWFPGAYQTTLGRMVVQLTEPVLKPLKRFNLQFAGLDFTVWVVMVGLNILKRLL